MEAGTIQLLLDASGVTALVGQRVTPLARQQGGDLPAVTVARVSGAPEYDFNGEIGLVRGRLQVDCWAETYAAAKNLAAAVTSALSAVKDTVSSGTHFVYITLDLERDSREAGGGVPEYLFRTSLDFDIWTRG